MLSRKTYHFKCFLLKYARCGYVEIKRKNSQHALRIQSIMPLKNLQRKFSDYEFFNWMSWIKRPCFDVLQVAPFSCRDRVSRFRAIFAFRKGRHTEILAVIALGRCVFMKIQRLVSGASEIGPRLSRNWSVRRRSCSPWRLLNVSMIPKRTLYMNYFEPNKTIFNNSFIRLLSCKYQMQQLL